MALIALNAGCLAAFQWGRKRYFRRLTDDRVRGGLGPIGTIFAVVQFPLVWIGGASANMALIQLVIFLYSLSLVLFFWAVRSHSHEPPGIAFSPDTPQTLVTSGAYEVARHPFYLAYLLFWIGAAIISPFFLGAPIFIVMAILYVRAASREEADIMRSPLANAYAEYRARVGMFFRWLRF